MIVDEASNNFRIKTAIVKNIRIHKDVGATTKKEESDQSYHVNSLVGVLTNLLVFKLLPP